MQFLLFDVSATLVFLAGYLTVVSLQRRRAWLVPAAIRRAPRPAPRPEREPGPSKPAPTGEPRDCQNCVKWPRLSAPR